MSNFTKLAMQNREAEELRKKKKKEDMSDISVGGGSSSGSESPQSASSDDSSQSSSAMQMAESMGSGVPSYGMGNFAMDVAGAVVDQKIGDVVDKAVDKAEGAIVKAGTEALEKGAKKLLSEGAESGLKKAMGKCASKLAGYGALALGDGLLPIGDAIALGLIAKDVANGLVKLATGKDIGEHITDGTDSVKGWMNDNLGTDFESSEEKAERKAREKEEKERKKEEKKRKEMEEAEKKRKEAEEKIKKAQEEMRKKEEEEEEEGEQEEEEEDEDETEEDGDMQGGSSTGKKGLVRGLAHTAGTFGGAMGISFAMIAGYRTHFTGEFEYKGIGAEYQNSTVDAKNFMTYDEDGNVVLTGLSKENKLMKTFYTKYSDKSYYAIVEDSEKYENIDDAYKKKNLLTPDELREQYPDIEDVNGREVMFQLNPDALYSLDKYIHQDKVMYPQQFVKPVHYEESKDGFALKNLVDDSGTIVAKSQRFDSNGKPIKTGDNKFETTAGIWDYGFASVLKYGEYEVKTREVKNPVKRDVVKGQTVEVSEVRTSKPEPESGPIPGVDTVVGAEKLRDKPAYIIDTAVTAGGTITNEIEQTWMKDADSVKTSSDTFTVSVLEGTREECKENSTENPPQEYTVDNGVTESCTTYYTYTEYKVTDHFETYVEEYLPQYKGDPSTEEITGSKYFRDYMSSYSNYLPSELPTRLDFDVLDNPELSSLIFDDDPINLAGGNQGNTQKPPNGETILIDAGHGDTDSGATGFVVEKDIVLQIAKVVKTKLESAGYKVLMTRDSDIYPMIPPDASNSLTNQQRSLKFRSGMANDNNVSASLSLHVNAPMDGTGDPTRIGMMTLWGKDNEGFARIMHDSLISSTGAKSSNELKPGENGISKRDLHMTTSLEMPALLLEFGYVTNKEESKKLADPVYQAKIADAIVKALNEFLQVEEGGSNSGSEPESESDENARILESIRANYQMREQEQNPGSGSVDLGTLLGIGKKKDNPVVKKTMQYMQYFQKYGDMYGVDPYILMAMACQESGGNPNSYNGAARGLMQIEHTVSKVKAFNHSTGQEDTITVDHSRLFNPDYNVQIGAMELSERLSNYKYNILMSLQGYNYGKAGIGSAVQYYLSGGTIGVNHTVNFDEVYAYAETNDVGWITATFPGDLPKEQNKAWLKNPNDGVHDARTWYSDTGWRKYNQGGGDCAYVDKIMQWYAGADKPWVKKPDGTVVTVDGTAGVGGGGVSAGTPAQMFNSYLNSNWNSILEKWDDLFPGQSELDKKLDIVKKGDYTELHSRYEAKARYDAEPGLKTKSAGVETIPRNNNVYSVGMTEVDKQLTLNMMFAMNQGNYLFKYDNMTEQQWKAMYTQLLSSPTGKTWDDEWIGFSKEDIFATKEIGKLFPEDEGISPVISVPYGKAKNSYTDEEDKLNQYDFMNFGIDIVVPPETDVLTVADGKIQSINKKDDTSSRYGNYVEIKHANGTVTLTANLKEVNVKVGDSVVKGDVIGTSGGGSKAYKDNALYYQITHKGQIIDPTWIITGEMTGFKDPIEGNNGVVCGPAGGAVSNNATINKAIEVAKAQVGKPYVWGAQGPNSFDCSGFMYYIMSEAGVPGGRRVAGGYYKESVEIPRDQVQPGDFIFWHDLTGNKHAPIYHIGLYMGDDMIIDCSPDHKGVGTRTFSSLKDSASRRFTVGRYEPFAGGGSSAPTFGSGCQLPGAGDSTASGDYVWPVPQSKRITAPFGEPRPKGPHGGIDIGGDYGMQLVSIGDGEVIDVENSCATDGYYGSSCGGGFGNNVKVKHPDGMVSIYAHMSKGTAKVKVGDKVTPGQEVGGMGNSGSSKGKHLHFEMRKDGDRNKKVDPMDYISPPS